MKKPKVEAYPWHGPEMVGVWVVVLLSAGAWVAMVWR